MTFLAIFCLFSSYLFACITFANGFFQFQDNKVTLKQANHEKTIFQPGQCLLKARVLLSKVSPQTSGTSKKKMTSFLFGGIKRSLGLQNKIG